MTDLNRTGTFAATTSDEYTAIPYNRAKSFRVTNFTGKVVGIRRRHEAIMLDDFNDQDFSEWTGDISYNPAELEGTGAAFVEGTAYRQLTDIVMLDGAEVDFTIVTPDADEYVIKLSVHDVDTRLGMTPSATVQLDKFNSVRNTKYKVTIRVNLTDLKYDAFIEEDGKDRVQAVTGAEALYGANQMQDSLVTIESDKRITVDPIVYQKKVNESGEQVGHGGSFVYPCNENTAEYEIVNLGSDALNYSDTSQTISISGFYAR